MKPWHSHAMFAGGLLFLLLAAGYRIRTPWLRGDEGYAGSQHQAISRHQLTHGLLTTQLAQLRVFHDLPQEDLFAADGTFQGSVVREQYGDRFWTSRLPFGALLHTASLALFGDQEWAVRLVPLTATLLAVLSLYLLLGSAYGRTCALACAVAFALSPGAVLHARLAGHEMPLLLLVMVTVVLYDRYRQGLLPGRGSDAAFWPVWIAALLAGMVGWFGLFLIPILLLESLRRSAPVRMSWSARGSLLLIPVLVCGLYVFYLYGLGQDIEERLAYFWEKRSLGAAAGFSMLQWLYRMQKFFVNHITAVPLLLSVGWGVRWIRSRRRHSPLAEERLVMMLGAFGACCYVLAMGSAYVHRYYILWWLPFIAVAGGFVLARCLAERGSSLGRAVGALAILLLAGSSVYKVRSHHAKRETLLPAVEFALRAKEHIPQTATIAVVSPGVRYGEGVPLLSWPEQRVQQGVTVERADDPGAPLLFYAWRRHIPHRLRFEDAPGKVAFAEQTYLLVTGRKRDLIDSRRAEVRLLLGEARGELWLVTPKPVHENSASQGPDA